ncbi:hypothetical protein C8J56DRAFT_953828 [Mycena floridula]|nr:hypothetical protein C8J56DRAFT_953828 [Mycena floridula]
MDDLAASVAALAFTNDPPLDTQAEFLRGTLLAEAENELAIVEAKQRELETRRVELQATIHDLKAVLSPIRRVPPEIWAEIFCFDSRTCCLFTTGSKAWILSQVSRSFRAIATSCSELWSDIGLFIPHYKNMPPDHHLLYLASLSELLKLLLPRANSWRTLRFYSWRATLEPLLEVQHELTNLQRVDFGFLVGRSIASPLLWKDLFRNCPELRKVSGTIDLLRTLNLPWSQITDCTVEDMDSADYVNFLHLAPNLQVLCAAVYGIHNPPYVPPTIVHSAIGKLTQLTLPNLKELLITTAYNPEHIIPSLHQFIARSRCPLRSLRIEEHHIDQELIEILDLLPSLEELGFHFSRFEENDAEWMGEMFEHLTNSEDVEQEETEDEYLEDSEENEEEEENSSVYVCVPKLETLEIHIDGHTVSASSQETWDNQLLEMVKSRRSESLPKSVVQLKKLDLERASLPALLWHNIRTVREVRTGGLQVRLVDAGKLHPIGLLPSQC